MQHAAARFSSTKNAPSRARVRSASLTNAKTPKLNLLLTVYGRGKGRQACEGGVVKAWQCAVCVGEVRAVRE